MLDQVAAKRDSCWRCKSASTSLNGGYEKFALQASSLATVALTAVTLGYSQEVPLPVQKLQVDDLLHTQDASSQTNQDVSNTDSTSA